MHSLSLSAGTVSASNPAMAEQLAAILTSYAQQWAADERRRQAIRQGLLEPPKPSQQWLISDRD